MSSSSSSTSSSSSSSSPSYAPAYVVRQCVRLAEPADNTIELISGNNLTIYVTIPYVLLRAYAPNLPGSGPDLVVASYTDTLGQDQQFVFNCTLTMSDNGYVILSADRGTQFLIASVNAQFWQANAIAINQRNANAGFPALQPCANAARYDYPALLTNQQIPSLFIYDGQVITSGSSSAPNVV